MKENEEREGKAQKVEQNLFALFNGGERAAGRSDAHRCSVVCSLVVMMYGEE